MKSKNSIYSVNHYVFYPPTTPPRSEPDLLNWRVELFLFYFFGLSWHKPRVAYTAMLRNGYDPLVQQFLSSLVILFRFFFSLQVWQRIDTLAGFTFLVYFLSVITFCFFSCTKGSEKKGVCVRGLIITCDVWSCYDHRGAGGFFFIYSRMDVGFLCLFDSPYSLARPWSWAFSFLLVCMVYFIRYQLGCVFSCFYFIFCMDVTWPSPENLSQQAVFLHFILSWVIHGLFLSLEHEVEHLFTIACYIHNHHPERLIIWV